MAALQDWCLLLLNYISLEILNADKYSYACSIFSYSIKPTLKKVSKYENKFAKLQKKAAEFNFRNQLKTVKKKEFTLEEEDKEHEVYFFLKCLE